MAEMDEPIAGQWFLTWREKNGVLCILRHKDVQAATEEDPDAASKCKKYKMPDGSIIEICI